VRGTPLYMAPEQITGTDVDHRSDLYAIGCTLFELVSGRPPFVDGDILFAQMNNKPPTPSSINPGLPRAVDDLILSLLEKNPDDRPGSANEVRTKMRDLSSV
jgi:eukaryotic-like serine/threonine-protein kinase